MSTFLNGTVVTPAFLNALDALKGDTTNVHYLMLGPSNMAGWTFTDSSGTLSCDAAGSGLRLVCVIPLLARSVTVYQQLTEVKIFNTKAGTGPTAYAVNKWNLGGSVPTAIATASSTTAGIQTTTIGSFATGPDFSTSDYIGVTVISAAAGDKVYGIRAKYNNSLYVG